ncbi:hypothetical protein DMC30DRAFT_350519 [Rhodotorula diobovata]|uniref:Uncharacterized protein n=1 Tax=Rhodotorula diobovata TaxID=5288 RepID=A0A5C5FX52_9BASI|nr:hypothetical protein DMC30DRAFT_350519 [Rhodotorula diobovata]
MPSHSELMTALDRYPAALELRAAASARSANLVQLDTWYRGSLFPVMKERMTAEENEEADPGVRMTKEELVELMEWKLARGKWRPRLQSLVASNSPASVRAAVEKAARASTAQGALDALCALSGVGPATASAVLAAWDPETQPFMSDEAMDGAAAYGAGEPGGAGKREYTVKAWRRYTEEMAERRDKEGWKSVEDLEKALWSWAVERKYGGGGEAVDVDDAGSKSAQRKAPKKRASEPAEPGTKKRKST